MFQFNMKWLINTHYFHYLSASMVVIMTGMLKQPTMKSQNAKLNMKQLFVVLILEDLTAIVNTRAFPDVNNGYNHYSSDAVCQNWTSTRQNNQL